MGTHSHADGFDASRSLQRVGSLAGFLFVAARLSVDLVGNRETYSIRRRASMGPQLLDFGGVDNYPFLARALRGWPFAQLDGRLPSGLNLVFAAQSSTSSVGTKPRIYGGY
jgi:hypothetical protein